MPIYQLGILDSHVEQILAPDSFARGTSREAFDVQGDTSVIVKRQIIRFPGANMMEWVLWNAVKDTELRHVFGECHTISETAQYLIMERLDNITPSDWVSVPSVPVWLNDKKPSAFGKAADGTIKVRDYALVDLDIALDRRVFPVAWSTIKP
jgi:hypothetical protein